MRPNTLKFHMSVWWPFPWSINCRSTIRMMRNLNGGHVQTKSAQISLEFAVADMWYNGQLYVFNIDLHYTWLQKHMSTINMNSILDKHQLACYRAIATVWLLYWIFCLSQKGVASSSFRNSISELSHHNNMALLHKLKEYQAIMLYKRTCQSCTLTHMHNLTGYLSVM